MSDLIVDMDHDASNIPPVTDDQWLKCLWNFGSFQQFVKHLVQHEDKFGQGSLQMTYVADEDLLGSSYKSETSNRESNEQMESTIEFRVELIRRKLVSN